MSIKNKEIINVLNYNTNIVTVSTKNDNYSLQAAEDDIPSILPLTPSEIEYINGNSVAFKDGHLRFPEEIEEEVYVDLLRIANWKDILTNKEIKEIILNPTIEGLQKLIGIKNSSVFERVRGIFIQLKNNGNEDVSTRVERIINTRYKELLNRQIKSDIILQPKDIVSNNIPNEEVNALKEQLAQMQKMMEQMMAAQSNGKEVNNTTDKNESEEIEQPTQPDNNSETDKKAGRPPKNK